MKSIEELIDKDNFEFLIRKEHKKFKEKLSFCPSQAKVRELTNDVQNMFSIDIDEVIMDFIYTELFMIKPFNYNMFRIHIKEMLE